MKARSKGEPCATPDQEGRAGKRAGRPHRCPPLLRPLEAVGAPGHGVARGRTRREHLRELSD